MTAEPADELAWRVPTSAELGARRRIYQRAILTGVAFTIALFVALKPAWWPLGLVVGGASAAAMAAWQAWQFRRKYAQLPPNMRLARDGFRWGNAPESSGEISRPQIKAFRIEDHSGQGSTDLVLILQDDFESQPIRLPEKEVAERVREWLRSTWSLEESPSPRSTSVGIRTLRLPIYAEAHPDRGEWHWEGSTIGLKSLAGAIRSAAEELPLPPAGAQPKVLEVVGTRRDGSELLIAVDREPWLDELTMAAPPEQLRKVADTLEAALESSEAAEFELELDLGDQHPWSIHVHRKGD